MNGKRGLVVLGGPIGTAETGCGDRVLFFGFSKTVLFDFFGSIFFFKIGRNVGHPSPTAQVARNAT